MRPRWSSTLWREADQAEWRTLRDSEVQSLPSHRESGLWLVTGLLMAVWDRLPKEDQRVRRLTTDEGEALIGRVLNPEQALACAARSASAQAPCRAPAKCTRR